MYVYVYIFGCCLWCCVEALACMCAIRERHLSTYLYTFDINNKFTRPSQRDMPASLCELRVLENHISKGGASNAVAAFYCFLSTEYQRSFWWRTPQTIRKDARDDIDANENEGGPLMTLAFIR